MNTVTRHPSGRGVRCRLFLTAALILAVTSPLASSEVRAADSTKPAPADASYVVRVAGTAPPRVVVHATLPSDGAELSMAQSRPGDVPEVADAGWPGLVRNLRVADGAGTAVEAKPAGPKGWALARAVTGPLTVEYEIDFAPLAARGWPAPRETAFADASQLSVIARSLFIFTPAQQSSRVRFELPPGWRAFVPWSAGSRGNATAVVSSTSDLTENLVAFSRRMPDVVGSGGFRLTVVAFGHWQRARTDVRRVVGAVVPRLVATAGFRGRADYLLVLLPQAESGGESFRASFALTSEATATADNAGIWGNLVAHEVFHYWNGWRLKGSDYQSSQWFQEGFTEYAANLAMVSGGLDRPGRFHERLAGHVVKYRKLATPLDAPGNRKGPPLYSGGALVAFIWDTMIREATDGKRGFADLMRALLAETGDGERPYGWTDIQAALVRVAPGDWKSFEQKHIHGREPLPVAEALARVGLRMVDGPDGAVQIDADPAATREARALWRALIRGSR